MRLGKSALEDTGLDGKAVRRVLDSSTGRCTAEVSPRPVDAIFSTHTHALSFPSKDPSGDGGMWSAYI